MNDRSVGRIWQVICNSYLCNTNRWRMERSIFNSKKYWLIPCILIQYIHSISTNIAYFRHEQMLPLKDWGYETIPPLPDNMRWLSEFIFSIIFFSILLLSFIPFFLLKPKYYMATIWIRALLVLFILIFLRSLSFLATSLPGPAPHCQPYSESYSHLLHSLNLISVIVYFYY